MSRDLLTIKVFDIDHRYWAVFFPVDQTPKIGMFWINPGLGISTRQAEEALKHIDQLHEITDDTVAPSEATEGPIYGSLRERIVEMLARARLEPSRPKPTTSDVYLFQTGMASIFRLHEYLTKEYNQKSVVYGFPFHSTYHVYDDFGAGFEFFGLGDEADLKKLEEWLAEGNQIQALLCEFPSNPLAVTPDIARLRQLADLYHFFLVIDDTVGSFCNVDVTSAADAIVTSLTKSFSGYADVMGGSLVLNPSMPRYDELKSIIDRHYRNDLYLADAEVLLSNSDDYLSRSTVLNRNSLAVATYFHKLAQDPSSPVKKVYYPSFNASCPLYESLMRPATDAFTPGYGCLMSIEFKDVPTTIAFHDALDVFKAPHLGGHCTLALPYVKGLFAKELDWAGKYDLRETMIRVAPGLEDEEDLLKTFEVAIEAARKVKKEAANGVEGGAKVVSMS